jgi:hypothetical protein
VLVTRWRWRAVSPPRGRPSRGSGSMGGSSRGPGLCLCAWRMLCPSSARSARKPRASSRGWRSAQRSQRSASRRSCVTSSPSTRRLEARRSSCARGSPCGDSACPGAARYAPRLPVQPSRANRPVALAHRARSTALPLSPGAPPLADDRPGDQAGESHTGTGRGARERQVRRARKV